MDIDFSPTGREFVTGSYDRSVRIFPYNGGHSREIYHTKRMQRYNLVNNSVYTPLLNHFVNLIANTVQLLLYINAFVFFLSCRVFCVKYSSDATYVISGSDDTNLRLWKAKASEQLGVVRICSFSFVIQH